MADVPAVLLSQKYGGSVQAKNFKNETSATMSKFVKLSTDNTF